MPDYTDRGGRRTQKGKPMGAGFGPTLSRRSFFETLALAGLGIAALPARDAMAWGSWSKGTSEVLKSMSLGDCLHEDITQIAYGSVVAVHKENKDSNSLINPWAGKISADKKSAEIAGDTVVAPDGTFANDKDLAGKLYRENLACLRIGSFWSDAAANAVQDLGDSITEAKNVPKFSGSNRYEGAWDVATHVSETQERNAGTQRRSLVQFAYNERANFMHGMLSTTADGKTYLKQGDIKNFVLQWMGVAYEYARTGQVTGTEDVGQSQAQRIIDGLVDPYGQEDRNKHDLCTTLKVGDDEASKPISTRQKRLRALGMLCHTMEDLWNPAHTCRVYLDSRWRRGDYTQYAIMAFANYRRQNGTASPKNGYHMPYDRYSYVDTKSSSVREDQTSAAQNLGSACDSNALQAGWDLEYMPEPVFKTLGMDEAISFTYQLLSYFFEDIKWDYMVRRWVESEVLRDCFDDGNSVICDAGRRSLHTPTYILAPIQDMKTAFKKVKRENEYNEILTFAKQFDSYQRNAFDFFVYTDLMDPPVEEGRIKYVNRVGSDYESDWGAEKSLHNLIKTFQGTVNKMTEAEKETFLQLLGCNGCHKAISLLGTLRGLIQEFSIDLRLSKNPDSKVMGDYARLLDFLNAGAKKAPSPKNLTDQASPASSLLGLITPREALADEADEDYLTTDMEILDLVSYDDGSYAVSVRDLGSLESAVMEVPSGASGKELLRSGASNLRITYTVEMEFEDDVNFTYVVSKIENPTDVPPLSVVIGTVRSVSEGLLVVASEQDESELYLQVADNVSDLPDEGDYVCAYYMLDAQGTEHLLDYVELDRPGSTIVAEYPVVSVYGSGMWLLKTDTMSTDYEDDGVAGGLHGEDNLMYVEFGSANISPVPQVGCMATVTYYDKDYYDGDRLEPSGSTYYYPVPEEDRAVVSSAAMSDSPVRGYDMRHAYGMAPASAALVAQSEDPTQSDVPEPQIEDPTQSDVPEPQIEDPKQSGVPESQADLTATPNAYDPQAAAPFAAQGSGLLQGSADSAGEYGDADYDSLDDPAYETYSDYWSAGDEESRHIATSVQGSSEWASSDLLLQLYGGLLGEIKHADGPQGSGGSKEPTTYHYVTNGDGTHRKYTTDPKNATRETCTYNSKGECIYCGYAYKPQGEVQSSDIGYAWPRTRYPQVMGYPNWTGNRRRTYRSSDPSNSSSTSTNSTSSTSTPSTPSTPATGGLLGGYTGSGTYSTPVTETVGATVGAPAAGVATTGTAATPVTGAATSPVAVLPNTADVTAGLEAIMYAAAAAGAALTAHGLKQSSHGRVSEEDEVSEELQD